MEPWLETFARANFHRSADTAHDLKTPLNVAVLNLELLRMRLRKLYGGEEDPKVATYAAAVDAELRRMGRIVDAFFILSTPPRNEEPPQPVDLTPICAEAAEAAGLSLEGEGAFVVEGHEARIRQAFSLLFEGASRILADDERQAAISGNSSDVVVTITGRPLSPEFDLTKAFKLYYTDPDGNPDISLAVARLIAETYGGELNGAEERDNVSFLLSLPLRTR